jgi:predicted ATPase
MSAQTDATMSTLRNITVNGFKSLADVDVDLTNLNILIGANGAGKSNFIGLFTLLNQIIERRFQVYVTQSGGPDAILTNGSQHTEAMDIHLHFGPNGYHAKFSPTQNGTLMFEHEDCWFKGAGYNRPYTKTLGSGLLETGIHDAVKSSSRIGIADHVAESFRGWKVYHFHDTSATAKVKGLCDVNDNIALRHDASNLAAFLFLMKDRHPNRYEQIVRTIRLVAPFFDDFLLRPDPRNNEKMRLEWKAKNTDSYFNAHSLSDGTIRFMCLTTLLLQPTVPTVIVVDEPELGLHPYAITMLASLLRLASKRTQVVVSTQSVTLVNQFEPGDVIVVDHDENGSVFKRPTLEDAASWLENYALGELWEKNIIGGRPR